MRLKPRALSVSRKLNISEEVREQNNHIFTRMPTLVVFVELLSSFTRRNSEKELKSSAHHLASVAAVYTIV